MGRRKIKIQPITHERNRSVTFLKRKNGLFKKAYELGVLCSVDVAVIIFEERPGQHPKLYQYSSSDINDIVKRHVQHAGEKDTRTLADFLGKSEKLEDDADGDEDDGDEEEEAVRSQSRTNPATKRRNDGKEKPENLQCPVTIPPLPLPAYSGQSKASTSSSLPISGERLSSVQRAGTLLAGSPSAKKARVNSSLGISRTSSDEASHVYKTSHSPHLSHQPGVRHSQNTNPGYNQPFSADQNSTPGFVRNGFDFSQTQPSRGLASRSNYAPSGATSYRQQHPNHNELGNFHQQSSAGHASNHHASSSTPSTADLFAAFLDSESRLPQGAGQQSFVWPIHAATQPQSQLQAPPPVQNFISQGGSSQRADAQAEGTSNWLSFLSADNSSSATSVTPNQNAALGMFNLAGPRRSVGLRAEIERSASAGSPANQPGMANIMKVVAKET